VRLVRFFVLYSCPLGRVTTREVMDGFLFMKFEEGLLLYVGNRRLCLTDVAQYWGFFFEHNENYAEIANVYLILIGYIIL